MGAWAPLALVLEAFEFAVLNCPARWAAILEIRHGASLLVRALWQLPFGLSGWRPAPHELFSLFVIARCFWSLLNACVLGHLIPTDQQAGVIPFLRTHKTM